MNPLRCIAVDDEPLALEVISSFAAKTPQLDLMATFQNPLEAIEFLQEHPADLIFLDINMPDLSGFELIQTLSPRPLVIFTTAHPEYAPRSYEFDAVDYLLKPFPFDRFLKAINKAAREKSLLKPEGETEPDDRKYLFIKSDTRYFKVNFKDILYIEGMRDYIAVHTAPQQRILTLTSMTRMLEKLPSEDFMRVHKSFIININHITLVQNNRVFIGQRDIPISSSYRDDLQQLIDKMSQ
jgi:DNA-binding LytR/AlgR family response regulator